MNERLKQIRIAHNLTQQEFADRIGIKRGTVANYELGRNEPIDAVVSLICREFRASEQWLRFGSGEMFETLDQDQVITEFAANILSDEPDSFRKRLISALAAMDTKDWTVLEALADKLTKNKTDP